MSVNLSQGQLVYTRDDRLGWIQARVVKSSDNLARDTFNLELGDGKRVKKKANCLLLPSDHTNLVQISNLTEVTPLNEATVLECLHQRFSCDKFYTLAGSTVIAINPFKDVCELYTMQNIWAYHEDKIKKGLEPHVYMIADRAYKCMKRRQGWANQSIVVSGESGAGKTVSAKHLLRFLTIVSSPEDAIDLDNSVPASVIEKRVLDSNPLLEAFGNAATPRNDNSSRFGKFIQLQFHRNGCILGGVIQTYLLEKTRVVHQRTGENNFHIFYQMMSLSDEPQIPVFLEPVKAEIQASRLDCSLTSKDGSCSPITTLNAMADIGIPPLSQVAIFQTLLAILYLTTLKFLPEQDGESSGYSDDQETVSAKEESARLLIVSPQSLHYSLLNRSIVSGDESRSSRRSVFFKPVTVAEAESRRDCLAMLLYSKLFDWLVTFINHQIKVDKFDHSIGLLDIYGFEAFEENSLEQLCINYANERLQQHYVIHFLRDLQTEYEAEGIAWKNVPYTDNKLCVEALDGSTGVFGVLNEDVYLNRKGVDHQVCNRIIEACNNSHLVHKPHSGTYGSQFIVKHFAGDVLYTVKNAVTKNKDSIPPELVTLLLSSSNSFITELFSEECTPASDTQGSRVGKTHKKKTVLAKFKSSLDSLLASLGQSDIHYIRCIKPNPLNKPCQFDRGFVLQQLQACGTVQTVDICRRGYPARMRYAEFAQRYQVLTRIKGQLQQQLLPIASDTMEENKDKFEESFQHKVEKHFLLLQGTLYGKDMETWQSLTRQCATVLETAFDPNLLTDVETQFGHSKIFLTQAQIEHLEVTRSCIIHYVVCKAQAWWKGRVQYRKYHNILHSTLAIQTSWRVYIQRQKFREMRQAVRVIQRGWRKHRLSQSLHRLSKASQIIRRSLVKWLRRLRFQKALEKLRKESKEFHAVLQLRDHKLPVNYDIFEQSPDHDDSTGSGSWSEDSGIMTQSDPASAPGNSTTGLSFHVDSHQENTCRKLALNNNEREASNFVGGGDDSSESFFKHSQAPKKRPWTVVKADREGKENQGEVEKEKLAGNSPSLKRVFRSSRDEGGGGDSYRNIKRGRKSEDLQMRNGVLTCRRLTRSGYRFHVRSSVLKNGHRTPHSYLPHGLPDALPSDDEDGDNMKS